VSAKLQPRHRGGLKWPSRLFAVLEPLTAPLWDLAHAGYEASGFCFTSTGRSAWHGASAPHVARWLGDIRTCYPSMVVQSGSSYMKHLA
jgi:hypothetical protein